MVEAEEWDGGEQRNQEEEEVVAVAKWELGYFRGCRDLGLLVGEVKIWIGNLFYCILSKPKNRSQI